MCVYPMCLRITAPFFDSTKPLSLECRGRDLVCSISSLFNNFSTVRLRNSLPLGRRKASARTLCSPSASVTQPCFCRPCPSPARAALSYRVRVWAFSAMRG